LKQKLVWELSHYAKQHPTASTRSGLNNVNKLGCPQLHMRFVAVKNQQFEMSMVTINNNQADSNQADLKKCCGSGLATCSSNALNQVMEPY
jgi:hypothetical protein